MIFDIARKEIKEIRKTRRLLVIAVLFAVATIAMAIYFGQFTNEGPDEMLGSTFFGLIYKFIPLLAIILAYDTIAGERSRGSLSLVFSKPVGRGQIFTGKFLAVFLFTGAIFLIVISFGYWIDAILCPKFPSATEIASAYKAFFAVLLVIGCWISFAMLFSTLFKSSVISLVISLILWIMVIPMISGIPVGYYLQKHMDASGSLPVGVEFPAWTRALFAINPDQCMTELAGHLLDFSSYGSQVLTTGQSIAAMFIFFGVFLTSAFLLFRRLSLE